MRKPRALAKGDRLAIVAPASCFSREAFDAGVREIEQLGLIPEYEDTVFARSPHGYVAGPAELRAAAIHAAWNDPGIAALVAVRGGYGSAQVLPLLDRELATRASKAFIGYSDITAILTYLTLTCGLVTFHGPMLDRRLGRGADGYDRDSFERVLFHAKPAGELTAPGIETVVQGEASGMLIGGTVTQLLASLGTPFAFDPPQGYVLLFDEVGERPYRLDRMITQLRQSGLLARASAIVVGELPGCDEAEGPLRGRAVVSDLLADFPGPVIVGFPSGHTVGPAMTVPFGVRCRVVTSASPRLVIEEAAVQ